MAVRLSLRCLQCPLRVVRPLVDVIGVLANVTSALNQPYACGGESFEESGFDCSIKDSTAQRIISFCRSLPLAKMHTHRQHRVRYRSLSIAANFSLRLASPSKKSL